MSDPDRSLVSFVAFASLGTMSTVQDLSAAALSSLTDGRPDLVAEETLCLVCVVSARAAAFGFRERTPLAHAAAEVLLELPFTWRDYHVAAEMLTHGAGEPPEAAEVIYDRLQRKMEFYGVHFAPGAMPGEHALVDKMPLWMGRVSPPGLHEMPDARIERMGLVGVLARHARLIREFAAQAAAATGP